MMCINISSSFICIEEDKDEKPRGRKKTRSRSKNAMTFQEARRALSLSHAPIFPSINLTNQTIPKLIVEKKAKEAAISKSILQSNQGKTSSGPGPAAVPFPKKKHIRFADDTNGAYENFITHFPVPAERELSKRAGSAKISADNP